MKKRKLSITEIENGIKNLVLDFSKDEFIIKFLNLYDIPKASITRAKTKFDNGEDFFIKNKLYYTEIETDVVSEIDEIEQKIQNLKSKPRYIIANNYKNIAALDTRTHATLNIPLNELPLRADFFLAWNGIEKAEYQAEHPADQKAAERFARLYEVLIKDNPNVDEHTFNLFLIRILFLLFAEDTGIMEKGIFTNVLKIRTYEDGSNFNDIIEELFKVLNISELKRFDKADWLQSFPYVNGKLFDEPHTPLTFTNTSRKLLIEAGELLNWNEINPDILGSMIQSVASSESRRVTGMHYTSVPNIMKVIKPLFLDELNDTFENLKEQFEKNKIKDITEKYRKERNKEIANSLSKFLNRISNIKFLDPACGSGNFLIITYKEIRRLEIKILLLLEEIEQAEIFPMSSIHLNNFSGIEFDDFAHEVSKLSLWIAEHQMNEEMKKVLPGFISTLLPLKDIGNIKRGNALRINWDNLVSLKKNDEIYIMGNPPYIGADKLEDSQKKDLDFVFNENKRPKLDYISAWFYLGAKFIECKKNAKFAFVTTNSINQGSQVEKTWSRVLKFNVQIYFAYPSFKWNNNAKNNANVIVSIIGLTNNSDTVTKKIISDEGIKIVDNINAYLVDGPDLIVKNRKVPISNLPQLVVGCRPNDNQLLIIEPEVYTKEIQLNPLLKECTRKYIGGKQFTNGTTRYCIWLPTYDEYNRYKKISFIENRINTLKSLRLEKANKSKSEKKRKDMINLAHHSYKFQNNRNKDEIGWFIPQASSSMREYIPMGFIDEQTIIADPNFILYSPELWQIAILLSRMHMVWVSAISGKLKQDYRYSAELIYNTFPIDDFSIYRKNELHRVVLEILDLREYEGGNLAYLYNKDTMPKNLRKKHKELDGIIERAYQQRPFNNDEERLSVLLKLYQKMIDEKGRK
ncbi:MULTISPECIES: class I SAM-dependent DNA methyltransferase [Staphylococcus]|uniref:class I SAM-dependent DNA methyltransferase n=1 Tax=Staphylococcus hominis TaxID=1290 RepID=UPI00287A668D|nr:DNA methyltransferase [Staphylococcus hominis]MDS3838742.1 N-6 DNA methylase [Staphylococcus hominis]